MRSRWHETIRCGSACGASRCWRSTGLAGRRGARPLRRARRRLDDELGLEPSAELRQLQRRILEQDPELDASVPLGDATSALPVPPNPLVGRERDLEALAELSRRDPRLLVLTGAEGAQDAPRARGRPAGGLELRQRRCDRRARALRDPGLLLPTIASAVGVAEVPSQTPLDTLAAAVSNREPPRRPRQRRASALRDAVIRRAARPRTSTRAPGHEPCRAAPHRRARLSGLSARRRRRRRALRTACSGVAIRLRGHGRERGRGARDLQARRRPAARDRARSRLDQVVDPESLARSGSRRG